MDRCGAVLEERYSGARVLPTTSCTAALEICALLLDLDDGDEVIVPTFTFVATASAFALHGARLVFADADPETLGPSLEDIERRITPRTRAVVTMHYGMAGRDLVELARLCEARGIVLVEDNAHGVLAGLDGRPLGTFGALAATSFHYTKSVSCGGGGALIVNDERFVERAETLLHRGTDLVAFRRGLVDAYRWVDHGSSFGMTELAAAHLLGQLEAVEAIDAYRRSVRAGYLGALQGWSDKLGFVLPATPEGCVTGCSPFPVLVPDRASREELSAHFAAHRIEAPFHYQPLHASPMGRAHASDGDAYPVASRLGECLLRLPIHNALTGHDRERVIAAALAFG